MPQKIIYVNAGFDIELGNYDASRFKERIEELELLGFALSKGNDYVVTNLKPDDAFYSYLSAKKIHISDNIANVGDVADFEEIELWGWNKQAAERISINNVSDEYFKSVKNVNSRAFSASLQKELNFPISAEVLHSVEEVTEFVRREKRNIVIKSNYGSSGTGFLIYRDGKIDNKDLKHVTHLFNKKNSVVTGEKWVNRTLDFSCVFMVGKDGKAGNILMNRLYNKKRGIFHAVDCAEGDLILKNYLLKEEISRLYDVCHRSADELAQNGYFGYAGFDGFKFEDGGRDFLQPFCEINARMSMARYAFVVTNRLNAGKYVRLISFPVRANNMVRNYEDLQRLFGKYDYDSERGEGILIVNPLYFLKNGGRKKISSIYLLATAHSYELFQKMCFHIDEMF